MESDSGIERGRETERLRERERERETADFLLPLLDCPFARLLLLQLLPHDLLLLLLLGFLGRALLLN